MEITKLELFAVHSIWLRDMQCLSRQKLRLIGYSFAPFFLLAFLGLGFRNGNVLPEANGVSYISFLTPGMMVMTLLFSCNATSFAMLWDREMGFLKEIMITPISRLSIILGRTAVGITVALFQSTIILLAGMAMGMEPQSSKGFVLSFIFVILITSAFIGLGLSIASFVKDTFGFNFILQFLLYPILFLSGALYPVDRFPTYIASLAYLDPLTYGVDGLRYSLLGINSFNPVLDLCVMVISCVVLLGLGAYLFEIGEWM